MSNPQRRPRPGQLAEMASLLKPFTWWLVFSVLTGMAAGGATVALLRTINEVLNRPGGMAGGLLLTFIALCAVSLVCRSASDISTNVIGQRLVAAVRTSLARKILSAPIDALERYRTHRLMPVLTGDVDMISDVAFTLAGTVIALAITLGCLAYLAWLSLPLFGLLLIALVLGTGIQIRAQARGVGGFWQARESEERLHKAYRAISDGAKELRMHRARRMGMYQDQIERTIEKIRDLNGRAINTYVLASAFGSALFFLLIALILGWAAFTTLEPVVLSGFVLVLLFVKGPIDQIASAVPGIGRASVAFQRIADMSMRFETAEPHLTLVPSAADEPLALQDSIALRGVRYAFDAVQGGPSFAMGPIDLTLRRGEMVFIVGDNGSGKTTFIKLLLGLYAPQQGEILLDDQPVGAPRRDAYRQLFTTVFADFFLFDELVAPGDTHRPFTAEEALPYLRRLEIDHKVSIRDGRFTTTDLSTGQRKRLALVHAYLEGRPVLVFDEWAADQDPSFRHVFYTEILPELRDRGHLVIAISHDDRYFHLADRLIQFRNGVIVHQDVRVPDAAAPVRSLIRSAGTG